MAHSQSFEETIADAARLLEEGKLCPAHAALEALLESAPDCAEANYLIGKVARRLEDYEEAADYLQLAVHYRPDHAASWIELGLVADARGADAEAAEAYREAVRLDPSDAFAQRRLGLACWRLRELEEAERALRTATALAADDPFAASDLGYVLYHGRGDRAGAEVALRRALQIDPRCADAHVNLGVIEQAAGRWDQAVAHYERALAIDPDAHAARLNRGLVHLTRGDFARGWEDYESRRMSPAGAGTKFDCPQWRGEAVDGKALLVFGEQGLGDEIMFASCIPDLLRRTDRIALYCTPRLEGLFRRSFPTLEVRSGEQVGVPLQQLALPWGPEYKVPIGSLPRAFRTDRARFPQRGAYLKADPVRVEHWRGCLNRLGDGLKVGISWRGGTQQTRREARSVGLAALAEPLAVPGVRLVSLQYGDCAGEIDAVRHQQGIAVTRFSELDIDYGEAAALVEALDLVVSVCTAVVHLCGALNRQAWVLVPAVAEWRYLDRGDTMPWYASVRLFRQRVPGSWHEVIQDIESRVQRWALAGCC